MPTPVFRVLRVVAPDEPVSAVSVVGDDDGWGRFEMRPCNGWDAAPALAAERHDALLAPAGWDGWTLHTEQLAVVIEAEGGDVERQLAWLDAGAQDVLPPMVLETAVGRARLRAAIARHRHAAVARPAHATDVLTGLPHERQLVEHMSHLLALREREPSPMALIVARIEGLETTTARFGEPAAGALRRKLAVRLRGAVRASDVVATIGGDAFAVLLSSIESPADTGTVERKLRAALGDTFSVGGTDVAVAVALGVAGYPADGDQPGDLLRRANALAASAPALGRLGHVNAIERAGEGGPPAAANDD